MESYLMAKMTEEGKVISCDGLDPNVYFGAHRSEWTIEDLSVIHGWQFKAVIQLCTLDQHAVILMYRAEEGTQRSDLTDMIADAYGHTIPISTA